MSDESMSAELARLRAEHRQVRDLLVLIQELTSGAVRSESVGDLFSRSFPTLLRCLSYDVGVAVMLEQNLDLYIAARENAETLVSDALVKRIRRTLENVIPLSFATTEVVVKSELHVLAAGSSSSGSSGSSVAPRGTRGTEEPEDPAPTGIEHETHAVLQQGTRIAGLLLLFRAEPAFSEPEQQVLAIFATQVSMLLDTIEARAKIANLADTDDLTGIWNKRYFRRHLPQEIERSRTFNIPLALLLFDIDEFKQINDSFGHVIGDVVLSELCGVVRETLRPTDILTRFGGDEFAIILPHTDAMGAIAVAERVLRRVRALTIPTDEEGAIQCSISMGIAEFSRDDTSANDLIRRADERLYLSKRQGKNRYTA